MFAPGQEQLSKEDIRAGEQLANQTVRMAITGSVLLYLCTLSRHILPFSMQESQSDNIPVDKAPFAIDFVRKFL
ncbi:hypothetical protein BDW42DRAFT_162830 [Aspergillus taichungensis]|uniref:Uncharacterized protein n=1 Tax=Aspergillus taichungensis TaxID=482145 RepID=A0A2J5I339_9EURO|nr:hypothetical protein BDW42DRAFT_162830 [Aspergillus taichungensis]